MTNQLGELRPVAGRDEDVPFESHRQPAQALEDGLADLKELLAATAPQDGEDGQDENAGKRLRIRRELARLAVTPF